MAPKTAKAKKADVKVSENEAPKKARGKAKAIEETEQDNLEMDIEEKVAPVKAKRGKKAPETNGDTQTNGVAEDAAAPPPTKRGRKKNEPSVEEKTNGHSADEESNDAKEEQNGDIPDSNGDVEETQPTSTTKGRKKQAKKEDKPKETSSRGKKAKQAEEVEEKEVAEEKPKGKGRGRKAQPKAEPEDDKEVEDEVKSEPTKGKKKAPAKKEKTPESEKESEELGEEKTAEPKKKEAKGRKGQGKKAQAKDEAEDKKDGDEEEEEVKESSSKKRKVNKKDKGDSKDEEEELPQAKVAKGKRGQKKAVVEAEPEADTNGDDEPQDTGEPTKRRRKPAEEKAPADTKKKAPPKNKTATNYEELDFSNSSKSPQGKDWNFKIASWNVDGVRAWMSKGGLDYIKYEKPDILCLQELKCAQDKLPDELTNLPGYHAYWLASEQEGYAGVGIYTTKLAINVQYGLQNEELDGEGRIITAEYEQFYLICTYVPNAGRQLVTLPKRLQWNQEFRKHVQELDKKKPVIICGDMNVAHKEIDLSNPKSNKKNAGFTEEERAGMTELLGDGFVDTYRQLYPDKTSAYTFWTYMMNARSKNVGWRLDYFIVSERLVPSVCDNVIRDQVFGSDHCPISLFLHLTSADKPKE